MKKIIFKLVFVTLFIIMISVSVGDLIVKSAESEDFTYSVNNVVQKNFNPVELGIKIGIVVFIILVISFSGFYILNIITLVSICRGTRKIKNENVIYQRDLSEDYNSAVASYIIDGTVEVKQDYQAVIVELQEKGLVYKENEKYKVKENIITDGLLKNQMEVLNQINLGNLNYRQFKKKVMEDAVQTGYVENNKKLITMLVILMFIFPATIFFIIYILTIGRAYMFSLTEKGKKEKEKILKLKRYLIDFSNLHELETTDNNIWGDYLAYAISLKVNKKLKVKRITL